MNMKHSNYYTDFDVNEEDEDRKEGDLNKIIDRLDSEEDESEKSFIRKRKTRKEEDYIQLTNLSKNFFDKSRPEMSQEEAIELYEKLQAGEITKEYYTMEIIYSLTNYCKNIIHIHNRKVGAEYLDLMQASYLAICEHIDDYDPYQTKPSQYFYNFIVGKQAEECGHSKKIMTDHYVKMASKLKKTASELGYSSFMDPEISPMILATKANISLATVINTINARKRTIYSIDEFYNVASQTMSPEELYLEKELREKINQQFKRLSSIERFVLKNHIADENGISMRKLINLFRDPKFRSHFSDCELPVKVTQNYLRQVYCRAVNRFIENKEIRKLIDLDETNYQSSYEQAPSEIILRFVEDEISLI